MLTITDVRYTGAFDSILKVCEPSEGDSYLVVQDIRLHKEHLFVVAKLDPDQHQITLEDQMLLMNSLPPALDIGSFINEMRTRFRFYYLKK